MATFTQLKATDEPSIYTNAEHVVSDINPLTYGGFTE